MLEELGGVVEIGELDRLRLDGLEGIGELRSDAVEGSLEGGDRRSDGGESVIGMLEGGELGEKIGVAGEDL